MNKHNHYFVDVSNLDSVDVYRMIELIGITCPVAQHVFKKAWATGKRGHKDLRRDWQDIADSAARRLQMLDEDAAKAPAAPTPINAIDFRRTEQWPDESRRVEQAELDGCECHRCIREKNLKAPGPLGIPLSSAKMILCPECGNKRCPKASDHRNNCTDSNDPGQLGSLWEAGEARMDIIGPNGNDGEHYPVVGCTECFGVTSRTQCGVCHGASQ